VLLQLDRWRSVMLSLAGKFGSVDTAVLLNKYTHHQYLHHVAGIDLSDSQLYKYILHKLVKKAVDE
jgi:hypothetical protein